LSDGPDSDVDPVGYALAQVLPLERVKTTDKALHTDVATLAAAFETVLQDERTRRDRGDSGQGRQEARRDLPGRLLMASIGFMKRRRPAAHREHDPKAPPRRSTCALLLAAAG